MKMVGLSVPKKFPLSNFFQFFFEDGYRYMYVDIVKRDTLS